MYNRDRSPEVDDVEGLAAAATKHLDLLKQKDKAESESERGANGILRFE